LGREEKKKFWVDKAHKEIPEREDWVPKRARRKGKTGKNGGEIIAVFYEIYTISYKWKNRISAPQREHLAETFIRKLNHEQEKYGF